MIRSINTLFLFLVVFLLSSCVSLTPYQMDVLRPAKVSLSPDIKDLVVVNNIEVQNDTVVPVALDIDGDKSIQFVKSKPDSFSNVVVNMLFKELASRQFFDTVKIDNSSLITKNTRSTVYPYDLYDLPNSNHKYNCDLALFLNHYLFNSVVTFEKMDSYYYLTLSITGVIQWQLYDLASDTLINTFVQRDTMIWDAFTQELAYPGGVIPSVNNGIVELSKRMGFFFADQITPYWEPVDRYYYANGSALFSTATDSVLKNNWVEAEKVWFYIYNNSKKLQKARAAHNIALSKEVQGQFREAGEWAFESLSLYKQQQAYYPMDYDRERLYYADLVKRYIDRNKLVEQIGGE